MGPITPDGAAVSWTEIDAWARTSRSALTKWEAKTIRKMSQEYAAQKHKAKSPVCEAPHRPIHLGNKALVTHIKALFSPFAKKKDKG